MVFALYLLLALVVSFLCSIAEAVLLSIPPSYIEGIRSRRPVLARELATLKVTRVDQSLAAILSLNTIAHTVGAIGAGAEGALLLGNQWVGVLSAVVTLLILFLSEIIPKTIGAVFWTKLVAPVVIFVRFLIVVMFPIVWVAERLTRAIAQSQAPASFDREEFIAMARMGQRVGELRKREASILENVLALEAVDVADILTPRTVMSALPAELTVAEAMKAVTRWQFSRWPIYAGDFDNVIGYVLRADILLAMATAQGATPLNALQRPHLVVPETLPVARLLERLLGAQQHMALVYDEYGSLHGLVTLEDVLETLMGINIVDESDEVEDMRILARELRAKRIQKLDLEPEDAQ